MVSSPRDERFQSVDGLTGALLEFGDGKVASFITSLGCSDVSQCTVVGEKGTIKFDPAFDFQKALESTIAIEGETYKEDKVKSDQFAGELEQFGKAIVEGRPAQPDGFEGLADIIIMETILESARVGKALPVKLDFEPKRPDPENSEKFSLGSIPELIEASAPSR